MKLSKLLLGIFLLVVIGAFAKTLSGIAFWSMLLFLIVVGELSGFENWIEDR